MTTIKEILKQYPTQIDYLDLELLIAHELKKPREFILAHPEYKIPSSKIENLKLKISRRSRGEPLAYIIEHKEFFRLDFKVNKNTLVPRPETELLVEEALDLLRSMLRSKVRNIVVADVGTGSGNIIVSIAKATADLKLFGIDFSAKALKIAAYNAKKHGVDKKIKFLKGDLLEPILKTKNYKLKTTNYIILANLPYLSQEIYSSADIGVKKYEPKSALLSPNHGLAHYEKLFQQINKLLSTVDCELSTIIEISPEQKPRLTKIIKKYLPNAKINFFKDLANKWRICKIEI